MMSFSSAALNVNTDAPESIPQEYILTIDVSNATQKINTSVNCDVLFTYAGGVADYANYSTPFLVHNLSDLNVGTHTLKTTCWTPNEVGSSTQFIKVTVTGETTGEIVEGLIWFLFILAVLGNITMLILILVKLVTVRETIFGVLAAWAFYVLMIIVNYQSGLMTTTFIYDISGFVITILTWSNGVLPAISLVVTMFFKGMQKKKPIGINELTGRSPLGRYGQ